MTDEMPKIVQQTGNGTESSRSTNPLTERVAAVAAGTFAIVTGALCTAGGGAVSNGCVFVILTVGARAGEGCGRILIRAVSFFGAGFPPGIGWFEGTAETPLAGIAGGMTRGGGGRTRGFAGIAAVGAGGGGGAGVFAGGEMGGGGGGLAAPPNGAFGTAPALGGRGTAATACGGSGSETIERSDSTVRAEGGAIGSGGRAMAGSDGLTAAGCGGVGWAETGVGATG